MIKKINLCILLAALTINPSFASSLTHQPSAEGLKTPVINQAWNTHLKNQQSAYQLSEAIVNKLKLNQTNEMQRLHAITTKADRLLNNKMNLASNRLGLSTNINMNNRPIFFNPLILQMTDATIFINSLRMAASETDQLLEQMHELATEGASGNNSQADMKNLETEFQALKSALTWIQTASLIDGDKNLSAGNLKITIGDTETSSNTLIINIPAFDASSLGLTNLHIDTKEAASASLDVIDSASKQLKAVVMATQSARVDDAITMLWTIATRLESTMILLFQDKALATQSVGGVYSDDDRLSLNYLFKEEIDFMKALQTYVSLSGPKNISQGSIHIQIGNHDLAENTLTIKLPVTDVDLTGLSAEDIGQSTNALHAIDTISRLQHNLTYSS